MTSLPKDTPDILEGLHSLLRTEVIATFVCVMIESGTRVENIDDIPSVADVDGVIIGRANLSASLGHLNEPNCASVRTCSSPNTAWRGLSTWSRQPGREPTDFGPHHLLRRWFLGRVGSPPFGGYRQPGKRSRARAVRCRGVPRGQGSDRLTLAALPLPLRAWKDSTR
jgi:HpcH/HpaI aldolase/citrate lyase family protein